MIAALEKLSNLPRQEREAAIPDIGTLLKLIEVEAIARQNRSAIKKSERLVRWQCTENPAHTICGFPSSGDDLERRCHGLSKSKKTDWNPNGTPICGARMTVIYDDNNYSDSGPMEKWSWPDRSGAR